MNKIEKFDPNQIMVADAEQISEINASVLEATRACTETCTEMVQLGESLNNFEHAHDVYRDNCSIIRSQMQRILVKL